MTLADHYAGEECPSCGGEVRRWKSKIVHAWLEIWWCQTCRSFTECVCETCETLKALAGNGRRK